MGRPFKSLQGHSFGLLLVVSGPKRQEERTFWECLCSCGNKRWIRSDAIQRQVSCGCVLVKHGHNRSGNRSKTYSSWANMHKRCRFKNDRWWYLYGGRGIKVCSEWNDFRSFLADMGERPEGKTLDRIDPDGNYCKENCKWSTPKEQSLNQRRYKDRF